MSASVVISFIGIAIALFLLVFLTMKGLHLAWVSVLAAIVLITTSGTALQENFVSIVGDGLASTAGTVIPLMLAGATFGKIISVTGAVESFSKTILRVLTRNASPRVRRLIGAFIIILIGILLALAGIDNSAILFAEIALAVSILNEVNIPRRFLAVLVILGSCLGGLLPGAPSMMNVLAVQMISGTTASAAAGVAIAGIAFILIFSLIGCSRMWEKDIAAGQGFEYGQLTKPEYDEERLPPWWLFIIPVAVVFITFNALSWQAFFSLLAGIVVSVVLLWKWIPAQPDFSNALLAKISSICNLFNEGSQLAGSVAIILINFALGSVISATPAFEWVSEVLGNYSGSINPYIIFAIIAVLVIGISASPSGTMLMFSMASSLFVPVMGIAPAAAHRIIMFSGTVLDTLPFGNQVVMTLMLTNTKHKEGYPPIFFATVLVTAINVAFVTILCMLLY